MDCQLLSCPHPLWEETLRQLRHDVYHCQSYVLREAQRTGTAPHAFLLKQRDRLFFLPYLLRSCRGIPTKGFSAEEVYDAASPYGYPGPLLSPAAHEDAAFQQLAIAELKRAFRQQGICSAFVRLHPILNEGAAGLASRPESRLLGHTVSVDLKLTDAMIYTHTRKGQKSTINRCIRSGFAARMVPVAPYLAEFMSVYRETMTRVGARESYRFSADNLRSLLDLSPLLHLCLVECQGEIASACLFFECGGIVQAHLGGTRTRFLGASPFSLLFDFGRHWAKMRGNEYFHLGGGLGGQDDDTLFAFKCGFSKRRHDFRVLHLITHEENYSRLLLGVAKDRSTNPDALIQGDFFPAYRFPE